MREYYKSYYLKEFNRVDSEFVKKNQYGVRVFNSDILNMKIGEMLNSLSDISYVLYYSNINTDSIQKYHKVNYQDNKLLAICEELANGVKIIFYNENEIVKYSIEIYDYNGKPKLRQEFNKDFELVEYCQSVYNETEDLIQEKIFFAESWTIHTEKML